MELEDKARIIASKLPPEMHTGAYFGALRALQGEQAEREVNQKLKGNRRAKNQQFTEWILQEGYVIGFQMKPPYRFWCSMNKINEWDGDYEEQLTTEQLYARFIKETPQ